MRLGLSALAFSLVLGAAPSGDGYFRFPVPSGDRLYFTAEGDLWRAPLAGGQAQRLTTHPSQEVRPAVSPDGKWLAFTAAYEGPSEVFVMPVEGGQPKRVSFEGMGSLVVGWTPKGEVLYAVQSPTGPNGQKVVAKVDPRTLTRTLLPVVDAQDACVDGNTLYFTRLGVQASGDNVRAYRGGAIGEIWRFGLDGKGEAVRLPLEGQVRRPMVHKDRLYFIGDQSGCDNLWSCRLDGTDVRQLTHHKGWDVRSASLGEGRIAYQLGADVRVFDLAKGEDRAVNLSLTSDFDQQREKLVRRPLEFLDNVAFALNGEKVVFTARGQVAVAGTGTVRRVEVATPKGSRSREATLSKDGKWVYALNDATGDLQIWRFPADGAPGGKALTTEKGVARVGLYPSPDGAHLAHTDRKGNLYLMDLAKGESRRIDSHFDGAPDVVWAPDGRTLAILRPDSSRMLSQILLYSLDTGKTVTLTSDKYESMAPAFSPDGRWLYFLSNRSFQVVNGAPWGDRNMGPYFDRRTKVYAVALQEGLRFPFQPKTELDAAKPEPKPEAKPEGKDGKEAKAEPKKPATPAIQWEGLAGRLFEVPLPAGNYAALKTDGRRLYFMDREGRSGALKSLEIGNQGTPADVFAADVQGFDLSADGKKILLSKRSPMGMDTFIVDAGPKVGDLSKAQVKVGDWSFTVDPQAEWKQMFHDAWRMHQVHFFDHKMRGLDWEALRRKYEPLVERVTDRAELNDVLAQMMGELGALHSQVRPGDQRLATDGMTPAYLGAETSRVEGGYRIDRLYRTEAELPGEAGPLVQAGVREGDLITSVNGRPVSEARDLSDLLRNRAGQQVLLGLKRGAEALAPVVVTPVDAMTQANLRYADWEEGCRRKVEEAGKGRIGYLHLRAMTASDINAFAREFYGQFDRDGLIIDVRRNNGGNIDSWVIEKLLRRAWAFWTDNQGNPTGANMQQTFRGHLVVLVDELTYSDGETFSMGIKTLGLGPLVGRRTAGAGVWLSDGNRLVDGGQARAAEMPQFHVKDGAWLIEGQGVAPDVEVRNLPHETFMGKDRQLETALQMLQDKLAKEPVKPFKPQAIPSLASGKTARQ